MRQNLLVLDVDNARYKIVDFTTYCICCKIILMKPELTTIKIQEETRRKLKLLAALVDKSMVDVLAQLVDEALKKVQDSDPA